MASTDPGPSNTEAPRKLTAAERKAAKLAKQREKAEESGKVLGEYAEWRKKIQGRAMQRLTALLARVILQKMEISSLGSFICFPGDTVNLKDGNGFLTVLEQINGLHTRGMMNCSANFPFCSDSTFSMCWKAGVRLQACT